MDKNEQKNVLITNVEFMEIDSSLVHGNCTA